VIGEMSDGRKAVCLLSALIGELKQLRSEVNSFRHEQRQVEKPDDPSDGMLAALRGTTGDRLIEECSDYRMLSVRARKTLWKLGLKYVSELDRQKLIEVKNCGQYTTDELMEFRDKYR